MYIRLYINNENKVQIAETDNNEIKRNIINYDMSPYPFTVISFKLVDMTDGKIPKITAHEFAEDLTDGDNEAKFGTSIVKIKSDFTVSLSESKAKTNTGNIKTCKGLKIEDYKIEKESDL